MVLSLLPSNLDILAVLLLFVRMSVWVMLMPVIGHRLVPAPVKIGLAFFFSVLFYPNLQALAADTSTDPLMLAFLAIKEMLFAAAIALMVQLLFAAVQFAGQVMSLQMGLSMANIFDPSAGSQLSLLGSFSFQMAIMLWLVSGADRVMILAMQSSLSLFPVGHAWSISAFQGLSGLASSMFVLALKMMAPLLLLMLLVNVALGLLSRAVPQIQVYFVSSPMMVGLGLFSLALAMPSILALLLEQFEALGFRIQDFFQLMRQ